jgi:hypothetical protein
MTFYEDNLKIKDALQIYFNQYHFKDGGYQDKFFRIKLGKILIPVPNIKARVEGVKIHDIHHLVTNYSALYKGEVEIGAWEIASGCGRYWVGWILNLGSILIGILFYQRSMFKAFLYGRLAKTNLYRDTVYNEELLNKTVGELRDEILPPQEAKNSVKDYLLFIFWCAVSLVYHFAFAAVGVIVVWKIYSLIF